MGPWLKATIVHEQSQQTALTKIPPDGEKYPLVFRHQTTAAWRKDVAVYDVDVDDEYDDIWYDDDDSDDDDDDHDVLLDSELPQMLY